MIAVDSNVVVALEFDPVPGAIVRAGFAARDIDTTTLVLPAFCVGEVWRVATEPSPGLNLSPATVLNTLNHWLQPHVLLLPGLSFASLFREVVESRAPRGAEIFDCQILALCLEHEVDELWTLDRRFPRDVRLAIVNPLITFEPNRGGGSV